MDMYGFKHSNSKVCENIPFSLDLNEAKTSSYFQA